MKDHRKNTLTSPTGFDPRHAMVFDPFDVLPVADDANPAVLDVPRCSRSVRRLIEHGGEVDGPTLVS